MKNRIVVTQTYEDGKLVSSTRKKNSLLDGKQIIVKKSHTLIEMYKNGKLHGKSVKYDVNCIATASSCNVAEEKYYENGVLIKTVNKTKHK